MCPDTIIGTVLVVDDEQDNLDVLERRLTSRGLGVVTAKSGREALEVIETARPDLLLLDVMMPGMSGLEVLGQIRSKDSTAALPVIIVTAKSDEMTTGTCIASGASDFVTKPFDFDVLLSRIMLQLQSGVPVFA